MVCIPTTTPIEDSKMKEVGMSHERLEMISSFMVDMVQSDHLPMQQVLVARRGQVVYENSVNVDQDAMYRIFSMTKPLTSLALMVLYEEGKFQLNDPLSRYIPAFKKQNMRVFTGGDASNPASIPCSKSIRVIHILTHTAGLSYGFDKTGAQNKLDGIYNSNPFLAGEGQASLFGLETFSFVAPIPNHFVLADSPYPTILSLQTLHNA